MMEGGTNMAMLQFNRTKMSPSKPERGNFANFYRNRSRVQRSEQTWHSAFWLVGRLFQQTLF